MQINLSEETIKTVYKTLKEHKSLTINLLRNSGDNTEKEKEFRDRLVELEDALQVFEELSQ